MRHQLVHQHVMQYKYDLCDLFHLLDKRIKKVYSALIVMTVFSGVI